MTRAAGDTSAKLDGDQASAAPPGLPQGTVTFVLTDIVGSTRSWEERPQSMREAMRRHDEIVAAAVAANGGRLAESGREGDSVMAAFTTARDALAATLEIQLGLQAETWPEGCEIRVRAALHTGEAELRAGHYYGPALYRCSRLLGIGHGGQILVSLATRQLVFDSLPSPAELRDLGSHRLRDLTVPEHVFQVEHPALPASFPPLRSPEGESARLPVPLTSFIDREREQAELRDLLAHRRLVTLTGAGGCGKTRLAFQVAAALVERYPDGIRLVELAAISDPGLVPATVARALGVREEADRSLLETVAHQLTGKRAILLLDNCEHLIGAVAELSATLLARCPGLTVLATSREALDLGGEAVFVVLPLELPDGDRTPEGLLACPSVQLFADRAGPNFRITRSDAAAVELICNRLEGIPLAIELAASRASVLRVSDIARRLDSRFQLLKGGARGLPARHRTLHAAIDWSHELLNDEERTLFRRVAVFAGDFDLDAAEAVCADSSLPTDRVLDVTSGLVAKSLVIAEEGRYRLLDTIREYARGHLQGAADEESTFKRLAEHLLELAGAAHGGYNSDSLDLLELHFINARPALHWCETADPELGLRLVSALYEVLVTRGHVSEARQWFERLLSQADAGSEASVHAHLLAGYLAYLSADRDSALSHLDTYLDTVRRRSDRKGIADGLILSGQLALFNRELDAALGAFGEVLAIRRELGDLTGEAFALHYLGTVRGQTGEVDLAGELFSQSLEVRTGIGRRDEGLVTLIFLGAQRFVTGDLRAAWSMLLEALAIAHRLGDRRAAWCLDVVATMAVAASEPVRALRLAGAASAMHEASGTRPPPTWRAMTEPALEPARIELGPAAAQAAWAEGEAMSFHEALDYARSGAPDLTS
jgi:predicted ATPase/class 3 adenylate cyclase